MPHSDHSSSPQRESFSDLPIFPDNVPTAPLLRISLQKLLEEDEDEQDRCWQACRDLGFFYLDVRNPIKDMNNATNERTIDGDALLHDVDRLFEVMRDFYSLGVEEKTKYDFKDQGSYFGYKGYGEGIVDKQGTKDRNEFYNVWSLPSFLSFTTPTYLVC
jgi:isopenicillin N synthase-like dioxygenase